MENAGIPESEVRPNPRQPPSELRFQEGHQKSVILAGFWLRSSPEEFAAKNEDNF